jgi:hypothetical protein
MHERSKRRAHVIAPEQLEIFLVFWFFRRKEVPWGVRHVHGTYFQKTHARAGRTPPCFRVSFEVWDGGCCRHLNSSFLDIKMLASLSLLALVSAEAANHGHRGYPPGVDIPSHVLSALPHT